MRPIDADAFKKVLSEYEMKHDKRRSFDDYSCGAANAYEHAGDLLNEAPTVDRPRGEWTRSELGYKCSACENIIPHCFMPTISVLTKDAQYDFCPNCGADMRGGDPE